MDSNIKTGLVGTGIAALCVIAVLVIIVMAPFVLIAAIVILKFIVVIAAILAVVWGLGALINIARGKREAIKNPFSYFLKKKKDLDV